MNSDPPTAVSRIGGTDFDREVLRSKQPVVVAFWAPWSQPCRIMRPVHDEVAIANAGRVKVLSINVDDHPDVGIWYDIQAIPTLLCFVSGKVCFRIVGTASKEAILSMLDRLPPTA